jgi:hypothetical protein
MLQDIQAAVSQHLPLGVECQIDGPYWLIHRPQPHLCTRKHEVFSVANRNWHKAVCAEVELIATQQRLLIVNCHTPCGSIRTTAAAEKKDVFTYLAEKCENTDGIHAAIIGGDLNFSHYEALERSSARASKAPWTVLTTSGNIERRRGDQAWACSAVAHLFEVPHKIGKDFCGLSDAHNAVIVSCWFEPKVERYKCGI